MKTEFFFKNNGKFNWEYLYWNVMKNYIYAHIPIIKSELKYIAFI